MIPTSARDAITIAAIRTMYRSGIVLSVITLLHIRYVTT